jgi:uncharacterized protein (UPF0128 family)
MEISRKYKILTLLAGIATALVIVFSQLFYFQAATYCQKKVETEQQSNKKETGHEAYISIPSNTIASVAHIEISDGVTFVMETLFEAEETETTREVPPLVRGLFHTLFRFIIAPNAP